MARIVIVPHDGEESRAMVDPIVLAAVVQSTAHPFSAVDARDNERAAQDLDEADLYGD